MDTVNFVNNVTQIMCINILAYILFAKVINYKENSFGKIIAVCITSFIISILSVIVKYNGSILLAILVIYFLNSVSISIITKNKLQYSIIVTFISLTITYLIYIISIILSGVLLKIINPNIQKNNIIILFLAIIIEALISYKIFRTRRLKYGITFLKNKDKTNNMGGIWIFLVGTTLIVGSLLKDCIDKQKKIYLLIGIIIELICMTIWIKRKITTYYEQKLKERTIEELESEIKERDEEINKILEENKEIATINHKYSNRIKSLENFSHQIMSKPELVEKMETEFGEDFINFEKQINNISEEYTKEIEEKIQHKNHLEKTGIFGIDNILEYMSNEAIKHNIKFNLKIHENIQYMIENIIDQSKLETLLGDHIKDAIIAINSSENTYKELLVEIGEIENCYQVCIYDTGIEFEISTLLNLGLKAITTHKLTGGSGIGFMTTFETLKATKASLIIEERHPIDDKDYTKAVRIKFDGKHEYRICSYRSKEIQNKNKDTRIIIE